MRYMTSTAIALVLGLAHGPVMGRESDRTGDERSCRPPLYRAVGP